MEMLPDCRDSIRKSESRSMEEERSSRRLYEGGADPEAEAEAGLRIQQSFHIQLQRERRRTRMAQFAAAGLLLLLCGVLAILYRITTPMVSAPDNTINYESHNHSSGFSKRQHLPKAKDTPSAMLTVSNDNEANGNYLLWEDGVGNVHIQGGFNYSNGDLIVPRNGLYRVFLQITYEIETEVVCGNVITNKVLVFRNSYQNDEPLLSAADTVVCEKGYWKKSLFTSGSFELNAKDILRATSSHAKYMLRNEHWAFFGAELVSDSDSL